VWNNFRAESSLNDGGFAMEAVDPGALAADCLSGKSESGSPR